MKVTMICSALLLSALTACGGAQSAESNKAAAVAAETPTEAINQILRNERLCFSLGGALPLEVKLATVDAAWASEQNQRALALPDALVKAGMMSPVPGLSSNDKKVFELTEAGKKISAEKAAPTQQVKGGKMPLLCYGRAEVVEVVGEPRLNEKSQAMTVNYKAKSVEVDEWAKQPEILAALGRAIRLEGTEFTDSRMLRKTEDGLVAAHPR